MKKFIPTFIFCCAILLSACSAPTENPATPTVTSQLPVATEAAPTKAPVSIPATQEPTATANPTLAPGEWMKLPVVPQKISETTKKIYARGQELGNNPKAFSKVGDSNSTLPEFFADFDRPRAYRLGDYAYLQPAVDQFSGSWGRSSLAVKIGMSTNGVLSPLWANWKECKANESPLLCEYRIQKPSFALIALGTNDAYDAHTEPMEERYRKVIELTIKQGIVPILATKADNLEGDHLVNETIVRLANEYDIPLMNFWAAMQELPDQGLETAFHFTSGGDVGTCEFDSIENLKYGWTVRNLTALQSLDVVWRAVTGQPPSK